ncbi:Alpha-1,3-mannosyl-glycoprotein 4-beta-N-acetylglucosaminyltransferase-like protein MGAT4E [Galemys pyrenaicus]|uniref:Alpha-1,3-mannosyl-glycoprotein 4-beta-N-acetylglucosaminyltransferase-like protein MGAT4E n=1 Tax=Galemys pyrenaicus TaxID=202257 RepID=A0A8J6AIW0_GALPY|nr:Alpha-1,3-mannosyl-glycoprotein 4-beta-N-acetylglucosaminyltransferase-like protein MGAT4E [Galemys pyrenaicus]
MAALRARQPPGAGPGPHCLVRGRPDAPEAGSGAPGAWTCGGCRERSVRERVPAGVKFGFREERAVGARAAAAEPSPARSLSLTAQLLIPFLFCLLRKPVELRQLNEAARQAWLTVGISAVAHTNQSSLLFTLVSLFRASSKTEQKRLTVLVHLADSDVTWLRETVVHISKLFSAQILAGQLLLIHAPPDAYPAVEDDGAGAHRRNFYSKQNVDHAFLVSFAAKLSDYFLLLDDNVFCAPNFVSHIRWKVNTLVSKPWALLEFSNMGFLGKLFHSRDLPRLAHFLLLFYKEKPLDQLIPHFRSLLAQRDTILGRPFLFYCRISYSVLNESQKATAFQIHPDGPDNPPGAVFTDMRVFDVHFPWEAYTLDESFFWTYNVSAGSHLTVVLNRPASLRRVQVLTGTIVDGKQALERGQVELGYDPEGVPQRCGSYALLGPLLQGQMDQEIVLKSVGYNVSCVRLVATASQAGGLMIRHIYLWQEKAREEAPVQS